MITSRIIPLLLLPVVFFACQDSTSQTEQAAEIPAYVGEIERISPQMDELFSPEAKMEVLSSGHDWTEGPVWVPELNAVLFSDIPPNKIFQWSEDKGTSLYLSPSGYTGKTERGGEVGSNGLLLDEQGRLVLCQHGDRRIGRMDAAITEPHAVYQSLADHWQGQRFNSPNDAAYHANGDLYFTDPPYGLEYRMEDSTKEIPFQGVYRLDQEGVVHLLTDQLSRPNGIAFSPDYQTAYVANSDPERAVWMAYTVMEDGNFANGRVFYDATSLVGKKPGLPDGLKVNPDGRLFATGPGGVLVFSPGGEHLGTLITGQATSNCALGNEGKFLYITADMYLLRIALL